MAASEHDQYSSRGDGGTELPPVLAEGLDTVTPQLAGNILRGVVTGLEEPNTGVSIGYISLAKLT